MTKLTKEQCLPPSSPPLPFLESVPEPIATTQPADPDEAEAPPEAGEVVAEVHADSTVTAPHVTFGGVIKVDQKLALNSTFQEVSRNTFRFRIGVGVGKGLRGVELWGSLCGVLMDGCTSLSACGKVGIGR